MSMPPRRSVTARWHLQGHRKPGPQHDQGRWVPVSKTFQPAISEPFVELVGEDHRLCPVINPLRSIHEHVCEEQSKLDDEVRRLAVRRDDPTCHDGSRCRCGDSIDTPPYDRRSVAVSISIDNWHLTPRLNQSGETDTIGKISQGGDRLLQTYSFEAVTVLLSRTRKCSSLKGRCSLPNGLPRRRRRSPSLARSPSFSIWLDGTPSDLGQPNAT